LLSQYRDIYTGDRTTANLPAILSLKQGKSNKKLLAVGNFQIEPNPICAATPKVVLALVTSRFFAANFTSGNVP